MAPRRSATPSTSISRCRRWGNTSFDVGVEGTASGKPVITATVIYVSVVPKKNTPTPVPAEVREALAR